MENLLFLMKGCDFFKDDDFIGLTQHNFGLPGKSETNVTFEINGKELHSSVEFNNVTTSKKRTKYDVWMKDGRKGIVRVSKEISVNETNEYKKETDEFKFKIKKKNNEITMKTKRGFDLDKEEILSIIRYTKELYDAYNKTNLQKAFPDNFIQHQYLIEPKMIVKNKNNIFMFEEKDNKVKKAEYKEVEVVDIIHRLLTMLP